MAQRIVEAVPEDELSLIFPKRPYNLTERGKEALKKYEWIPYIHAHSLYEDLDIWNLTELMRKSPSSTYRDVIGEYLNKRAEMHLKNNSYGLYRNSLFQMSEFLAGENRWKDSFDLLCIVSDFDLSGLFNGFNLNYAPTYFPYERSFVKMAPGILNRISKCQSKLGWDEATLVESLYGNFSRITLPFHLFTNEECIRIILDECQEDKEDLEIIYKNAEKRFLHNYRKNSAI